MRKHKIIIVREGDQNLLSESDMEMDHRAVKAVEGAIHKAKVCKKPIARYDIKTRRAYLEYPDGKREYVDSVSK